MDIHINFRILKFIIICPDQFILGIDMALRSFANYSIITYGTFAMWGALLSNQGEVAMPQDHVKTDVGRNIQKAQMPYWKFI